MKNGNKQKRKRILRNIVIILFVFLLVFALYQMYNSIQIADQGGNGQNNTTIERTSQTVEQEMKKSNEVADVLEKVNQSVVGISKIKDNGSSVFLKDSAQNLGLGTGFIVSENGYIVTNEHVSGGRYSNCYVTLENGKSYQANVVWSDSSLDLSIIKINMKGLAYLPLGDSDSTRVGESVYAIGNPVGFEFQRTVTSGIISAVDRTIKFEEQEKEIYMSDLFQTDATINPGNSGGPLITPEGNVIGINSVKLTSAEGISFSVPINIIKPIIQKYIQTGNFEEGSIGVFAYDKNVIPYLDSNLKIESGIFVAQLVSGGPAEKAGVKVGEIITKIDGIELNKMNDLKEYLYSKNPNDEVTLTIQKGVSTNDVKVILVKK